MKIKVIKLISKNVGLKILNENNHHQLKKTTTNYKTEHKNRHASPRKKASNLSWGLH